MGPMRLSTVSQPGFLQVISGVLAMALMPTLKTLNILMPQTELFSLFYCVCCRQLHFNLLRLYRNNWSCRWRLQCLVYLRCFRRNLVFNNLSTPADVSSFWDFGDGSSSYLDDPSHTFDPGSYNVCLTVFGADSCISEYCQTITIFGGGDSTGCSAFLLSMNLMERLNLLTYQMPTDFLPIMYGNLVMAKHHSLLIRRILMMMAFMQFV